MPEFIREVTISIEIDTNKRTITKTCSSISEAYRFIKMLRDIVNIRAELNELEHQINEVANANHQR